MAKAMREIKAMKAPATEKAAAPALAPAEAPAAKVAEPAPAIQAMKTRNAKLLTKLWYMGFW